MSIKLFVNKALTERIIKSEIFSFGKLSIEEVEKLKTETKLNLSGYERVVENKSVFHAFEMHGNEQKEIRRHQIAITPDDFERIPELTKEHQKVGISHDNILIHYYIEPDRFFVYVEEIDSKRRVLNFQTLYKRKIRDKRER